MHALKLLHNSIEKSAVEIHKKRLIALFAAVEGLINGHNLTLTGLGRSIQSQAKVKHNIKRVDRLLGNQKLHLNRSILYRELANKVLRKIKRPIILIDWSQLGENNKYYFISASLPYGGRSLTIYEEAHPKKLYNTTPTNTEFLVHLKDIIPKNCKPIIVTDAGTAFRCPWFKKIRALYWDFVGRVRGGEKLLIKTQGEWFTCKQIYAQAKKQAVHLGKGLLTKRSKFVCELFLAKRAPKGRHGKKKNEPDTYESNDRTYARKATDPWLLATSLDPKIYSPNLIISIYKQRMQIEELFRDTKNQRIGFGLKKTLTLDIKRLNILLLIGTLAIYAIFILGKTAQRLSLHLQFQSNTIKHRAVLSIFNLGCQVFLYGRIKIPITKQQETFKLIPEFIIHAENISW